MECNCGVLCVITSRCEHAQLQQLAMNCDIPIEENLRDMSLVFDWWIRKTVQVLHNT